MPDKGTTAVNFAHYMRLKRRGSRLRNQGRKNMQVSIGHDLGLVHVAGGVERDGRMTMTKGHVQEGMKKDTKSLMQTDIMIDPPQIVAGNETETEVTEAIGTIVKDEATMIDGAVAAGNETDTEANASTEATATIVKDKTTMMDGAVEVGNETETVATDSTILIETKGVQTVDGAPMVKNEVTDEIMIVRNLRLQNPPETKGARIQNTGPCLRTRVRNPHIRWVPVKKKQAKVILLKKEVRSIGISNGRS